jgi:Putative transposase.
MPPALEVADIFRRYGPDYIQAHEGHLGRVERRVMSAIELCRTAALGGHVEGCRACGAVRVAYNSCRNRHCPKCQGAVARDWLEARADDLLPVPYFHVVFTLPAEIASIAFQNKKVVYTILFRTAAETLRIIAADPIHLGARIGLIAVLHSWGQTLSYHPHLHCIVPGGGPSPDGIRWVACRPNFFLPVRVLSRLFRRLFLQALRAAFEAGQLTVLRRYR